MYHREYLINIMNKQIIQNIEYKKGFTIIETLVAIAILMISIAGPLTIAEKGYNAGILARDQVIAAYLAQDALEYIKNIKDNNLMASPPRNWLMELTSGNSCDYESSVCSVDTVSGNPNAPGGSLAICIPSDPISCLLYLGDNGYTHNSSGTIATKYSRYFYIDTGGQAYNVANLANLVVVVKWTGIGGVDNIITFKNDIYNVPK